MEHRRNSNLGLQFYMMAWKHIWSWRRKLAFNRVENNPSGRSNLLQLRTSSLCSVAGSFTVIANQLGPNLGLETLHDGMREETWSWREEPSTTLQCSWFGARRTDSHFTELTNHTKYLHHYPAGLHSTPDLPFLSLNASLTDYEYFHHPSLLSRWATATWGDFNQVTGEIPR